MVELDRQKDIQQFLSSTGLDVEDRAESLEAWRRDCNRLVTGFFEYIENRFSAIEERLKRIEEERCGHQKD